MIISSRKLSSMVAGAALASTLAGCDLDVINPGTIDAATFNPAGDASTISLSAQTRFWNAFGTIAIWQGYFSGETWAGAARLETSDVARRAITSSALDVAPVWGALQSAIASNGSRCLAGLAARRRLEELRGDFAGARAARLRTLCAQSLVADVRPDRRRIRRRSR